VVICGSATSWMIQKVVNHTGGLHNRITQRIHLSPFTLSETESYLKARQVYADRYQIAQIYMAMGGIPHYLNTIKNGNFCDFIPHFLLMPINISPSSKPLPAADSDSPDKPSSTKAR